VGPILTACIIGGTIGLVWGLWRAKVNETKRRKIRDQKRARQKRLNSEDEEKLLSLMSEHFDALKANHDKAVYSDEYGTIQYDKWEKELARFFRSVGYSSDRLTPSSLSRLSSRFIIELSEEQTCE